MSDSCENVKLLIFDIDGTLIDLSTYDGDYFEATISEVYGISTINKNWRKYKNATDFGILSELVMEHFGRQLELSEFLEFEDRLEQVYLDRRDSTSVHPLSGANSFVKAVKANPCIQIGIATGNSRKIAEHKLKRALFDTDDFVISSSNDSMYREEILKNCEKKAKKAHGIASYDRVIYFGDRVWDYKATKDAGYDFIGIGRDIQELKDHGVQHCLPHFKTDILMDII